MGCGLIAYVLVVLAALPAVVVDAVAEVDVAVAVGGEDAIPVSSFPSTLGKDPPERNDGHSERSSGSEVEY